MRQTASKAATMDDSNFIPARTFWIPVPASVDSPKENEKVVLRSMMAAEEAGDCRSEDE